MSIFPDKDKICYSDKNEDFMKYCRVGIHDTSDEVVEKIGDIKFTLNNLPELLGYCIRNPIAKQMFEKVRPDDLYFMNTGVPTVILYLNT